MDLVVIGLSSLAALMTLTLLVWVSLWQMRRKNHDGMAELICLGFLKQSFRVEQDCFDLPKTPFWSYLQQANGFCSTLRLGPHDNFQPRIGMRLNGNDDTHGQTARGP